MLNTVSNLRVIYIKLSEALSLILKRNPREHNTEMTADLISEYGFQDPPRWSPALSSFGHGNGRILALQWLKENNKPIPLNIIQEKSEWLLPIIIGGNEFPDKMDLYTIEHNNSVLGGKRDTNFLYDMSYGDFLVQASQSKKIVTLSKSQIENLLKKVVTENNEPNSSEPVKIELKNEKQTWICNERHIITNDAEIVKRELSNPVLVWANIYNLEIWNTAKSILNNFPDDLVMLFVLPPNPYHEINRISQFKPISSDFILQRSKDTRMNHRLILGVSERLKTRVKTIIKDDETGNDFFNAVSPKAIEKITKNHFEIGDEVLVIGGNLLNSVVAMDSARLMVLEENVPLLEKGLNKLVENGFAVKERE